MNIFTKQYATKYGGCFAVGCLGILIFYTIIFIPNIISMRERDKEYLVRENMRIFEKILKGYSTKHQGYYPIAVDTSFIQGMPLKNPFNKLLPSIVTMTDTIKMCLELQKGQMAYMPLDITDKGALKYRIFGKGRYDRYLMDYRLP